MQSDGEKLSERLQEFGASVVKLIKDIGSRKDATDAKFAATGRGFSLRSWRLGAIDIFAKSVITAKNRSR